MIHSKITRFSPDMLKRRPVFRILDVCNQDIRIKKDTLWMECAAYAEVKRLTKRPVRDMLQIELLYKHLALLTLSSIVIVDLDHRYRILQIAGHPIDYRRLEFDDWYKAHLLGEKTPPWRILALRKNPKASIAENRMLLHGLLSLSMGIPTIYCLYEDFETILVEAYGLDIRPKPPTRSKRSSSGKNNGRAPEAKPDADKKARKLSR